MTPGRRKPPSRTAPEPTKPRIEEGTAHHDPDRRRRTAGMLQVQRHRHRADVHLQHRHRQVGDPHRDVPGLLGMTRAVILVPALTAWRAGRPGTGYGRTAAVLI